MKREKVLGFAVMSLGALALGAVGTFAWMNGSASKLNAFEGAQFGARIAEDLTSNLQLAPGAQMDQQLTVSNRGTVPEFVRLKLTAHTAQFTMDTKDGTGTGNIVYVDKGSTVASFDDYQTWVKGATYRVPNATDSKGYWQIDQANAAMITDSGKPADASGAAGKVALKLNTKDWKYEDGYFYYLKKLPKGATTTSLVNQLTVDTKLPNTMKGALYGVEVQLDAVDSIKTSLTDQSAGWGLSESSSVYKELSGQVNK